MAYQHRSHPWNLKAVSDSQLPTLSAVTIASNNGNTAKAKVGDIVTITFSASEKLNTNTVSATSTSGTTLNWTERATSTNPAVDEIGLMSPLILMAPT